MQNKQQPWWQTFLLTGALILAGWALAQTVHEKTPTPTNEAVSSGQMEETATETPHSHEPINLTDSENAPTVQLNVTKDALAGWNIELVTTNFEFTPAQVNSEPVIGEGHAHLYVDDKKLTRMYNNWFYLSGLEEGIHTIRVELNANDHAPYTLNGMPIEASIEIEETGSADTSHDEADK